MKTAARWLFIICLPILLATASVSLAVNSKWLYSSGFERYDVGMVTGLEQAEMEKAADGLIDYFNSGEEYIDVVVLKGGEPFRLFNEREVGHLRDVKGLFRLVYRLLLGTAVYALLYIAVSLFVWKDRRLIGRGLFGGGMLTLALMVALGLTTLFNFQQLFRQFHLISFANDLWMLDPATDYLIMLFPGGFWYDTMLFCVLVTAVLALASTGVGWWMRRKGQSVE